MVTLGDGKYTYALSGTNWGNLPAGANYKEATSVAVDSQDNVYVFNRGTHPMVVYDSDGNLLRHVGTRHLRHAPRRRCGAGRLRLLHR